jgi:hypothetical protein
MEEGSRHTALNPSAQIVKEARKRVKAESVRRGEPAFHMTEGMRRLSTPWFVALSRASSIDPNMLPAGVILDAAAALIGNRDGWEHRSAVCGEHAHQL